MRENHLDAYGTSEPLHRFGQLELHPPYQSFSGEKMPKGE